jgi:L-lactate utilization protein LutC
MENTELKLVEQSGVELLTQAQIAERHGRSVSWVSEKIKQLDLKPVTEANDKAGIAATYDYKQFIFSLRNEKVKTTVAKVIDNHEACKEVIKQTFENMDNNIKMKFALEAMAAALQALDEEVKQRELEAEQLKIKLDEAMRWATVKRVLIDTGIEYPWRPLKKYSIENGYTIEKVYDKQYGETNAYHTDVWNAVYGVEI